MNLFTNTFNYHHLCRRKAMINQPQQHRSSIRTASANSGLLLAFTLLHLLLIIGGLPTSTNGFKIMARDTGEKRLSIANNNSSAN